MRTKLSDSRIRELVSETLSERFEGVDIIDIEIEAEDYIDGERVLRISVVFDSKDAPLDGRATAGVLRNLIPKMNEIGDAGFPLMSYISRSERKAHKAEPR